MPKPNMYQSLHTTVIGREAIPFEIQIRTWEMHHTAEYGIAAHWKYKEGISKNDEKLEQRLSWIRQLIETQRDSDDEEEDDGSNKIVEACVNILKPFVLEGMLFDNWDNYGRAIYEELAPIFEDVVLNGDGEVKFPSGNGPQDPIDSTVNSFKVWDNNFGFDFRLSLLDTADELKDYIDGDLYFKTAYPQHNLVRARSQMALAADMERKLSEMNRIVAEVAARVRKK